MDAQTQGPDLSLEGSNRISDGQLMKIKTSSRQGLEADGLASKIWKDLEGFRLGVGKVLEGSRWAWR
jgi:hypothetical protein